MPGHLIKKGARLTEKQKEDLAKHQAKGHGKKHMASMRLALLKGMSFSQAHDHASKKYK